MYQLTNFNSRAQLDQALAERVSKLLQKGVSENGRASLAVSGGSTPKGFFTALSNMAIEWQKITITLVDERWVDINSEASNTRLVHTKLLVNKASLATFFPLKKAGELSEDILFTLQLAAKKTLLPLDVVILGMGEDGHTASLFPCSNQITVGLEATNDKVFLKIEPKSAPYQRISFSFRALQTSKNVFLHVCGDKKKQVLAHAFTHVNHIEMPISAFLQDNSINTQIYWAK